MRTNKDWWRGAVIYQVYPRSFFDSNGDGIGDIPGVTAKLDYIASLQVDAIWLSPFFKSPMKDFGYDVSDYRAVDPIFGTLEDFDRLVEASHQMGLRVIIDHVLSHTSDQHPWFLESRSSRDNPKHDWYVWANARPDGTPPNNWLAVFGGSAWAWDSRRRQYFMHNFLTSQPDLNYHNPEVVNQLLSDLEFWLQRGVDGFRLDAVNFCYHDKLLRDNPAADTIAEGSIGVRKENPYAFQQHKFDKTRPENLDLLKKIRALLDSYPGTTTVGEIGDDNSLKTMATYTSGGDKLHMAYTFDLLMDSCGTDFIRRTVARTEESLSDGWPCWATGNHDVARVATRWGDGRHDEARARMFMVLLLTLRGSVCLYQGEELGLDEADLAYEDLVDPYGIAFWPEYKGRDGCRTAMPWDEKLPNVGFSIARPWLPVSATHLAKTVALQHDQPHSMLNIYREFLAWRKQQPTLVKGDIYFYQSEADTLCYERQLGHQRLLVVLNLSDSVKEWQPLQDADIKFQAEADNLQVCGAEWQDNHVRLAPYSAGFAYIIEASPIQD
jgi:alpha-glucosidase